MPKKTNAIDELGIGNHILNLSLKKSMSLRKIVSHLEAEGYHHKGKTISYSSIHRWLKAHKDEKPLPDFLDEVMDSRLDVEAEVIQMFSSCKKIFKAQLRAINKIAQDGGLLDTKSLYSLLSTAKTLLKQLELYMQKVQGTHSRADIQVYINEYNIRTIEVIKYVVELEIKDEKGQQRFIDKLGETFADPPERFLESNDSD